MSIVYIAKGTCHLGRTTRDKDGKVTESIPAHFNIEDPGNCVAVGYMDADRMVPEGAVEGVYGDWDAAGYLGMALQLLKPDRTPNIPDIKKIVQKAYTEDGSTLLCDYCSDLMCDRCIVREWRDEVE